MKEEGGEKREELLQKERRRRLFGTLGFYKKICPLVTLVGTLQQQ